MLDIKVDLFECKCFDVDKDFPMLCRFQFVSDLVRFTSLRKL